MSPLPLRPPVTYSCLCLDTGSFGRAEWLSASLHGLRRLCAESVVSWGGSAVRHEAASAGKYRACAVDCFLLRFPPLSLLQLFLQTLGRCFIVQKQPNIRRHISCIVEMALINNGKWRRCNDRCEPLGRSCSAASAYRLCLQSWRHQHHSNSAPLSSYETYIVFGRSRVQV